MNLSTTEVTTQVAVPARLLLPACTSGEGIDPSATVDRVRKSRGAAATSLDGFPVLTVPVERSWS